MTLPQFSSSDNVVTLVAPEYVLTKLLRGWPAHSLDWYCPTWVKAKIMPRSKPGQELASAPNP